MSYSNRLRTWSMCLVAALSFALTTVSAVADTPILSAPEAQTKVASGEIVLLDIRTRQEWQETGVAEGAWPVSMHEADFGDRLQAILQKVPSDRIAVICATGGRTAHVTNILRQNGIEDVIDVSEGMMGNPRGPGWIARGQSVVTLEEALADYSNTTAAW